MNICFFDGEIITEPEFKFIISNNLNFKDCIHISITIFKIRVKNNTVVTVKAYDGMADYCFKNLKIGNYIFITGKINDKLELTVDFCEII